uniref:Uncharacterized protein n=1 Tax=Panagrolaimus davidi TaxID=227884 RepID=A0A914PTP1_9BILA
MRSCHDEDQRCSPGFNRILLTTIDNCPYYQCANIALANAVESHQGILKPPYIDRDLAMSKTRYSYRHQLEELEKENDDDAVYSEDGDKVGKIAS